MFNNFYNMLGSPSKMIVEYNKIMERAKIMDNIFKNSKFN